MLNRTKAPRLAGGLFIFLALLLQVRCELRPAASEERSDLVDLSFTFDSPEALARTFLDSLEREDVNTLLSFALSEDEFRRVVWPQLPSSRPERGISFEYGWNDLRTKSLYSLNVTLSRYKGRHLAFRDLRFQDETTDYGTYLVHRDARVKVYDVEKDEELWLDLFGSVLERNGRFKLFSYVTD